MVLGIDDLTRLDRKGMTQGKGYQPLSTRTLTQNCGVGGAEERRGCRAHRSGPKRGRRRAIQIGPEKRARGMWTRSQGADYLRSAPKCWPQSFSSGWAPGRNVII